MSDLRAALTAVRQEFLNYAKDKDNVSNVHFDCGRTAWAYDPVAPNVLRATVVRAGKLLTLMPEIASQKSPGWRKETTAETRWYRFLLEFELQDVLERVSGPQSIVWEGENTSSRHVQPERRGARRAGWLPRFHLISINAINWLRLRMEEEQPPEQPGKSVAEVTTATVADSPPERLLFHDDGQTVTLDGKAHTVTNPKAFALFREIAKDRPTPKTKAALRTRMAGCQGTKTISNLLRTLPVPLRATVLPGGPNGFAVTLAPIQAKKAKKSLT